MDEKATTSPPIDAAELRRRSRILANRAEPCGILQRMCRFCGAAKDVGSLDRHIRRQHADALRALPAGEFA